jgi:hypothetical protein
VLEWTARDVKGAGHFGGRDAEVLLKPRPVSVQLLRPKAVQDYLKTSPEHLDTTAKGLNELS